MGSSHDKVPAGPKRRSAGAAPKSDHGVGAPGRYLPDLLRAPTRLDPLDVLRLQRYAGNQAATLAVQRHQIPPSREAVGEEDDEVGVQLLRDPAAPVQRRAAHRSSRRTSAFGRTSGPGVPVQLWGRGPQASVQRKGPMSKLLSELAAEAKAAKQYSEFVGGGPYKINDFEPDFTENFGKFDTIYDPGAKQLTVNMRVKFTFPDLPVPAIKKIQDFPKVLKVRQIHAAYVTNFLDQVQKGWGGKFQFRNVRQPETVWGKLNPISVKLNVTQVHSNEHYTMKAYLSKAGVANVSPNPPAGGGSGRITLFKGDLDSSTQGFTGSAQTGTDEVARLKRNLPKIRFSQNSAIVEPQYIPDLQFVADYLKRMNRPKFTIDIVGHASKTGKELSNEVVSKRRAENVHSRLKGFGLTNHVLTQRGVGSTGATRDGTWRKVDFGVTVDPGFSNVQDTTLHEFGHMLGLDDEYVTTRAIQLKHQRNFVRKMLGDKSYGAGDKKNKYADEVSKVDPLQSGSVMYSGDEVRVYHYVTMWQGLYNTAEKAAKQPAPKFSFKDWKVIG